MNESTGSPTTRREFLKTSALAGGILAAPAILPSRVFGAGSTETLRVGLVGCGGRGTGAAGQALHADKNAVLTAMGDAFDDQIQKSLQSLQKEAPDQLK